MSQTAHFLLGTGRGTAAGGGGGSRPDATWRDGANPLSQPLRVCHLPTGGEETQ